MKDEKEIVRAGMLRDYLELPEEELKNIANERGFDPILVHDYKPHVIEKIENIVGKVNEVKFDEETGALFGICNFVEGFPQKIIDMGRMEIAFSFNPICSICGEPFEDCPHWIDEAHVVATNVKVDRVDLVSPEPSPAYPSHPTCKKCGRLLTFDCAELIDDKETTVWFCNKCDIIYIFDEEDEEDDVCCGDAETENR
jgi:hypothetical protein